MAVSVTDIDDVTIRLARRARELACVVLSSSRAFTRLITARVDYWRYTVYTHET